MSYNGTVRCGYCYERGHNRRGCPKLKKEIRKNPEGWQARRVASRKANATPRVCSYCQLEGHNKRTCATLKTDRYDTRKKNRAWRTKFIALAEKIGLAPGALVEMDFAASADGSSDWHLENGKQVVKENGALAMVMGFETDHLNHELSNGERSWAYRQHHIRCQYPNGQTRLIPLTIEFAEIAPNAVKPGNSVAWKLACKSDCSVSKCFDYDFKSGATNVDNQLGLNQ